MHTVGILSDTHGSLLDFEISEMSGYTYYGRVNYEVSMRLIDYEPWWQLIDSFGRPIGRECIRFDPQYDNMQKLLQLFEILRKDKRAWDNQQAFDHDHRIRWWRRDRGNWEISVLRHEWMSGREEIT